MNKIHNCPWCKEECEIHERRLDFWPDYAEEDFYKFTTATECVDGHISVICAKCNYSGPWFKFKDESKNKTTKQAIQAHNAICEHGAGHGEYND